LGLEMIVEPAYRLPQLNSVYLPDGVDDAAARNRLLDEHNLEIGAGLGDLAGKAWRIGLMGASCDQMHVEYCLKALGEVLGRTDKTGPIKRTRKEFTQEPPFDASLMVARRKDYGRKRFGEDGIRRMLEAIALASLQESEPETSTESKPASKDDSDPPGNEGQLIADATCAPADIRYPTDVSLLNEAREKTEEIIDELHTPLVGKAPRPRTYREKARKCFVAFTKHKKPGRKKIRRAKREQLGFLRRNFRAIDRLGKRGTFYNGIVDFCRYGPTSPRGTNQTTNLGKPRPIAVCGQPSAGLQATALYPTA